VATRKNAEHNPRMWKYIPLEKLQEDKRATIKLHLKTPVVFKHNQNILKEGTDPQEYFDGVNRNRQTAEGALELLQISELPLHQIVGDYQNSLVQPSLIDTQPCRFLFAPRVT
jgi:hypothetical protein